MGMGLVDICCYLFALGYETEREGGVMDSTMFALVYFMTLPLQWLVVCKIGLWILEVMR